MPRAATARTPRPAAQHAPRVAAIVLAAGQSRRMGQLNKLLAEIDGVPMVRRAVDAARASKAEPVVVVTGHEPERVRATLGRKRRTEVVHNPDYAAGLSTSLARGLAALPAEVDGRSFAWAICRASRPRISID